VFSQYLWELFLHQVPIFSHRAPLYIPESESRNHKPFDFGARLRFEAATAAKINISPGTPIGAI
jgi:hypothetical protein